MNALPPRSTSDLQRLAVYIRDELNVDALMVSEIDADSPLSTDQRPQSQQLNEVALEMGDNWKYFLGRSGGDMRLGLLFNTDRVRLKKLVNLTAPPFPVSGKDVLDRDPFIVWISALDSGEEKNDVILICVHLKSQQGAYKNNRMAAIAKLIGDFTNADARETLTLPSKNEEPEAIILGDCNDSSFKRNGFKYLFDYLDGVGFKHLRNDSGPYPHTRVNGSQIDHLFGSKKIVDETLVPDSFKVHTVAQSDRAEYRQVFSDHFPVTIELKATDDTDFTLREAFAEADASLRQQKMEALQKEAFARALGQRSAVAEEEDEDDGELMIDFESRDGNFNEILAPTPGARRQQIPLRRNASNQLNASAMNGSSARALGGRAIPVDRFAKSDMPVRFLSQNWSNAEAHEFYSLRQGSPLMRRDFFDVLEQPDSTELFRDSDYLASFGFLPRRPHPGNLNGYPVGFVGGTAIELTCAACHTSKLTFGETEYWIDGSQAMTDVETWLHKLVDALKSTIGDAPDLDSFRSNERITLDQETKFGRFARRLTGRSSLSVAQVKAIKELLSKDLSRRERYNAYNDFGADADAERAGQSVAGHAAYGFGRLDALGAILNQATAEDLDKPENAHRADAPVNYPAIWDAPQHEHVQWNGSVNNTDRFGPLGRNAGQVVGVFGLVEIDGTAVGYNSSINFDAIERAEELVTKLWSPKWPVEFGAIDDTKAAAGEAIYRANCIECHRIIDRDDPGRRANDVLVPIHRQFLGTKLKTDDLTARRFQDRKAKVGPLAGRLKSLPFQGRFSRDSATMIPSRDILSHIVFGTIARSFVPWRGELTLEAEHANQAMVFSQRAVDDSLMRYKARPLNGVWSTAPFLHNGSVLNMVELLRPPSERRVKFRVGTTQFDPNTLGYKDAGSFELDTTLPGNSSRGHSYGTSLTDLQRKQLLEYVKSL